LETWFASTVSRLGANLVIPEDYPIFIDWATDVGIDTIGRQTGQSDLHPIVERFRSRPRQNTIMFSELKDRIDPWHYHPNYVRLKRNLKKSGHSWESLGNIFQQSEDLFNRDEWKEKPIKYIEKGDVDMETGTIRSFTEHTLGTLPTWAHWILHEGDVLFPRAYDSMRGVAVVPKEYESLVCTGGLIVVRHNPKKIRLPYVRYHFSRPEILALIKQFETGEINPKYTWTILSMVEVPLPGLEEQDRILKEIADVEKKRESALKTIKGLDDEIDAKIRHVIPKLITNY